MTDEKTSLFYILGVTPEQIVGYSYSGLLSLVCFAIVNATAVKALQETLGSVTLLFIVLGLGLGIYTLYFRIVGELCLYPFQYGFHHLLDKVRGCTGHQHTATISYLAHLGVPLGYRHAAYQEIKASFYSEQERRRIQLAHGELHVLYITAVIVFGFAVYAHVIGKTTWPLIAISGVSFLGAIIGDTFQHTVETRMIKGQGLEKIENMLRSRGFLGGAFSIAKHIAGDGSESNIDLHHVGITTTSVEEFERFWCGVMGFKKAYENKLASEMTEALFGIAEGAYIARYDRDGGPSIELHSFKTGRKLTAPGFDDPGFNHVCLHVGNRESFIRTLPASVRVHEYCNPGGWKNIFLKDFEGNWIELRENRK